MASLTNQRNLSRGGSTVRAEYMPCNYNEAEESFVECRKPCPKLCVGCPSHMSLWRAFGIRRSAVHTPSALHVLAQKCLSTQLSWIIKCHAASSKLLMHNDAERALGPQTVRMMLSPVHARDSVTWYRCLNLTYYRSKVCCASCKNVIRLFPKLKNCWHRPIILCVAEGGLQMQKQPPERYGDLKWRSSLIREKESLSGCHAESFQEVLALATGAPIIITRCL